MIIGNNKPLRAIGFETAIFNDLRTYLQEEGYSLGLISVDEFLTNLDTSFEYINLVTRDFELRKVVSAALTNNNLTRFSFLHNSTITTGAHIKNGVFLYPGAQSQPNSTIKEDVIIFPYSGLGHNSTVGRGTIMSSQCIIAGSTTVGEFCQLSMGVKVADNLSVSDDVFLAIGSLVTKSISVPGRYYGNKVLPKATK